MNQATLILMMIKNLVMAVICLLIGSLFGYQLRSHQQGQEAASSVLNLKSKSPSATAPVTAGVKATSATDSSAHDQTDIVARMNSLLENYNDTAAQKDAENLSVADIQTALAALATMPKSADRDSLRWTLYRTWAKTNPTGAWKAALADPLENGSGYLGHLLGAIAAEMAKTQPEAAVSLALSLGMDDRRTNVFQALFHEWGKNDPAGAIAYWNKHPDLPVQHWSLTNAITQNWKKDPLGTAKLALTLTDQQARSGAVSNLMTNWAAGDPSAALNWAQSISNPSLRQSAIADALRGWSNKDPLAAMTQAQTIQDQSARSSAMQSVWSNWLRKDPSAAMTFLGSSNDEKLMAEIEFNFAYNTQGLTQQEKIALVEKLPDGKGKQQMTRRLADSHIEKGQYNQAMSLLNNLPDSSDRDRSVQQLGATWAQSDLKVAAEWLNLQPDSSDRDLAVAGFASVLARTDPQDALKWAETIPDKGVRAATLKNIALRWLAANPASAEMWLTGVNGLSESEKQDLRATVQSARGNTTYIPNVRDRR
jgi:hypothetical protein